ncbi:hypothetical protein F5Y16DRAFT_402033 [Xylariaceae sp. FL0255]|nr:hypothetical protein F5Y16DRAFT_402033 [Xylariaceae sp. FL0255]
MSSPENLQVILWTLTGTSALFLVARCYAKLSSNRRLWWDDYFLLASWALLLVYDVFVMASLKLGLGTLDVPLQNYKTLTLYGVVETVVSLLATAWSKTSFAIVLLQITRGLPKAIVWFSVITVNLTLITDALVSLFECSPVYKAWNYTAPGHCLPYPHLVQMTMGIAFYSAANDFILATIPWVVIPKLQMNRKEKFGIAIALSLGLIAGSAGIVRAVLTPVVLSADSSVKVLRLSVWTVVEIATTIMATSVPVLRVLLVRVSKAVSWPASNRPPISTAEASSTRELRRLKWPAITHKEFPMTDLKRSDRRSNPQTKLTAINQRNTSVDNQMPPLEPAYLPVSSTQLTFI